MACASSSVIHGYIHDLHRQLKEAAASLTRETTLLFNADTKRDRNGEK